MLFIPNDALGEIQLVLFEERRVVAKVRIPTPDVETMARHQHAGNVAEPSVEHFVKRFIGHEVIGERAVLSPHFLPRGLGLLRVPGKIEPLVMLCPFE